MQGLGGGEHKVALFRFPQGEIKITPEKMFKKFKKELSNDKTIMNNLNDLLNSDSLGFEAIKKLKITMKRGAMYGNWLNYYGKPKSIMTSMMKLKCLDIFYYLRHCLKLRNYTRKQVLNYLDNITKLESKTIDDLKNGDNDIKQHKVRMENIKKSYSDLIKLLNDIGNTFKIENGMLKSDTKKSVKDKINNFDILKQLKGRNNNFFFKTTKKLDMSPISDLFNYKSQLHNFTFNIIKAGYNLITFVDKKNEKKRGLRKWTENIWPLIGGTNDEFLRIKTLFEINGPMYKTFKGINWKKTKNIEKEINYLLNELNFEIVNNFTGNDIGYTLINKQKKAFNNLDDSLREIIKREIDSINIKRKREENNTDERNETVNRRKVKLQKKGGNVNCNKLINKEWGTYNVVAKCNQGIRLYEILNRICLISHEFVSSYVTKMLPIYYFKYSIDECIINIENRNKTGDNLKYSVYELRMDIKNILKRLNNYSILYEYSPKYNELNEILFTKQNKWDTVKMKIIIQTLKLLKDNIKDNGGLKPNINLFKKYGNSEDQNQNKIAYELLESTIYQIYDTWNMNMVMARNMQEEEDKLFYINNMQEEDEEDGDNMNTLNSWDEDNKFNQWNGITQLLDKLVIKDEMDVDEDEKIATNDKMDVDENNFCDRSLYLCIYGVLQNTPEKKSNMDQIISQNIVNKLNSVSEIGLRFVIVLDIIYNILNDIENPYIFSSVIDNLKKNGLYKNYKNKMKTLNGWDIFTRIFNNILLILDLENKKNNNDMDIDEGNNSTIIQNGGGGSFRVCGNYCGPGWCNGKMQSESNCDRKKEVEKWPGMGTSCPDKCCRTHDGCCTKKKIKNCNKSLINCLEKCGKNTISCTNYGIPVPAGEIQLGMEIAEDWCCNGPCDKNTNKKTIRNKKNAKKKKTIRNKKNAKKKKTIRNKKNAKKKKTIRKKLLKKALRLSKLLLN